MKLFIAIILLTTIFASCSKNQSKSTLKINIGQMFTGSTVLGGGVYLVGHSMDDKEMFQTFILDPNIDFQLDLPKGNWEFAAIGWTGISNAAQVNNIFTGSNLCAYVGPVNLIQDTTTLTFNFDYATCANVPNHGAVFADPATFMENQTQYQFLRVQIESCNSLDMSSPTYPRCVDANNAAVVGGGLTRSARFNVLGMQKGTIVRALPGVATSCITFANDGTSGALDLRIPAGNVINGSDEKIFNSELELFTSSDCSGTPLTYNFGDHSIANGFNFPNQKEILYHLTSAGSNFSKIFIEHNPMTVSNNIGYNRFGYGSDGDLVLSGPAPSGTPSPNPSTSPTTSPSVSPTPYPSPTYAIQYFTPPSSDFGHVVGLNTDMNGHTVVAIPNGSGSTINLNDEVMIYVNNDINSTSCGSGQTTDFMSGMFFNARVIAKSTTPFPSPSPAPSISPSPSPSASYTPSPSPSPSNTGLIFIELDRDITQYQLNFPGGATQAVQLNYPPATSLNTPSASYPGTCSIQILKVRNYRKIIMGYTSGIRGLTFSDSTHYGGILAFKVSDGIEVTSAAIAPAIVQADYVFGGGLSNGVNVYNSYTTPCYQQGKACMYLGGSGVYGVNGGGLILAEINNIYFKGTGDMSLNFMVDAGSTYMTSGNNGNAGQMNINIGKIYQDAGVLPKIDLSANAAFNPSPSPTPSPSNSASPGPSPTPYYSGQPGPIYITYCSLDPQLPTLATFIFGHNESNNGPMPTYFNLIGPKCN